MIFAIFHDFPGLENGLPKFCDFHDQGAPCLPNDCAWWRLL